MVSMFSAFFASLSTKCRLTYGHMDVIYSKLIKTWEEPFMLHCIFKLVELEAEVNDK